MCNSTNLLFAHAVMTDNHHNNDQMQPDATNFDLELHDVLAAPFLFDGLSPNLNNESNTAANSNTTPIVLEGCVGNVPAVCLQPLCVSTTKNLKFISNQLQDSTDSLTQARQELTELQQLRSSDESYRNMIECLQRDNTHRKGLLDHEQQQAASALQRLTEAENLLETYREQIRDFEGLSNSLEQYKHKCTELDNKLRHNEDKLRTAATKYKEAVEMLRSEMDRCSKLEDKLTASENRNGKTTSLKSLLKRWIHHGEKTSEKLSELKERRPGEEQQLKTLIRQSREEMSSREKHDSQSANDQVMLLQAMGELNDLDDSMEMEEQEPAEPVPKDPSPVKAPAKRKRASVPKPVFAAPVPVQQAIAQKSAKPSKPKPAPIEIVPINQTPRPNIDKPRKSECAVKRTEPRPMPESEEPARTGSLKCACAENKIAQILNWSSSLLDDEPEPLSKLPPYPASLCQTRRRAVAGAYASQDAAEATLRSTARSFVLPRTKTPKDQKKDQPTEPELVDPASVPSTSSAPDHSEPSTCQLFEPPAPSRRAHAISSTNQETNIVTESSLDTDAASTSAATDSSVTTAEAGSSKVRPSPKSPCPSNKAKTNITCSHRVPELHRALSEGTTQTTLRQTIDFVLPPFLTGAAKSKSRTSTPVRHTDRIDNSTGRLQPQSSSLPSSPTVRGIEGTGPSPIVTKPVTDDKDTFPALGGIEQSTNASEKPVLESPTVATATNNADGEKEPAQDVDGMDTIADFVLERDESPEPLLIDEPITDECERDTDQSAIDTDKNKPTEKEDSDDGSEGSAATYLVVRPPSKRPTTNRRQSDRVQNKIQAEKEPSPIKRQIMRKKKSESPPSPKRKKLRIIESDSEEETVDEPVVSKTLKVSDRTPSTAVGRKSVLAKNTKAVKAPVQTTKTNNSQPPPNEPKRTVSAAPSISDQPGLSKEQRWKQEVARRQQQAAGLLASQPKYTKPVMIECSPVVTGRKRGRPKTAETVTVAATAQKTHGRVAHVKAVSPLVASVNEPMTSTATATPALPITIQSASVASPFRVPAPVTKVKTKKPMSKAEDDKRRRVAGFLDRAIDRPESLFTAAASVTAEMQGPDGAQLLSDYVVWYVSVGRAHFIVDLQVAWRDEFARTHGKLPAPRVLYSNSEQRLVGLLAACAQTDHSANTSQSQPLYMLGACLCKTIITALQRALVQVDKPQYIVCLWRLLILIDEKLSSCDRPTWMKRVLLSMLDRLNGQYQNLDCLLACLLHLRAVYGAQSFAELVMDNQSFSAYLPVFKFTLRHTQMHKLKRGMYQQYLPELFDDGETALNTTACLNAKMRITFHAHDLLMCNQNNELSLSVEGQSVFSEYWRALGCSCSTVSEWTTVLSKQVLGTVHEQTAQLIHLSTVGADVSASALTDAANQLVWLGVVMPHVLSRSKQLHLETDGEDTDLIAALLCALNTFRLDQLTNEHADELSADWLRLRRAADFLCAVLD